jgi:hypothetical protein
VGRVRGGLGVQELPPPPPLEASNGTGADTGTVAVTDQTDTVAGASVSVPIRTSCPVPDVWLLVWLCVGQRTDDSRVLRAQTNTSLIIITCMCSSTRDDLTADAGRARRDARVRVSVCVLVASQHVGCRRVPRAPE